MNRLKLLAQDGEDLKIISAHLQDAVMRVGDMVYLPRRRRFVVVMNRFCWECGEPQTGARVEAGLHFDSVLKVQSRNIRQEDPEALASLLAIEYTPAAGGGGMIDLVLCGGGLIRLGVECIDASLTDLSEPRPAIARPMHNLEA